MADTAKALCQLGATADQVADTLKVTRNTLYVWAVSIPAFGEALRVGKAANDDLVERTLFQRAMGYTTTESKRKFKVSGDSKELTSEEKLQETEPNHRTK